MKLGEVVHGPDLREKTPAQLREREERRRGTSYFFAESCARYVIEDALERFFLGKPRGSWHALVIAHLDNATIDAAVYHERKNADLKTYRDSLRIALSL